MAREGERISRLAQNSYFTTQNTTYVQHRTGYITDSPTPVTIPRLEPSHARSPLDIRSSDRLRRPFDDRVHEPDWPDAGWRCDGIVHLKLNAPSGAALARSGHFCQKIVKGGSDIVRGRCRLRTLCCQHFFVTFGSRQRLERFFDLEDALMLPTGFGQP